MRTLQPPIIPQITFEGDTRNFDEYAEIEWKPPSFLGTEEQKLFEDF